MGVTTQAVSNWERGGVPDAEIIPSIADAFGVTTDKLFGRKEYNSLENMLTDELLSMGRTEGFKKGFSLIWAIAPGLTGVENIKDSFGNSPLDNIRMSGGCNYYARASLDEGMLDSKINTECRYWFYMPEPEEGYARYFENVAELSETLSLLADRDILKILFFMYSRKNIPVALSVIASRIEMDVKKAERLMNRLCDCCLVTFSEVETENGRIKAYSFLNETVVIPLLCFAKELRDKKYINWGVFFDRQKPLF